MSTLINPRLYAIITAIEKDLRNLLRREVFVQINFKEAVGDDAHKRAVDRYKKDGNLENEEIDENLLVEFLDFQDCIHTLNRNKSIFSKERNSFLKNIDDLLKPVATIRNRVMHGRLIEVDELQTINDISNELKKFYKSDFSEHTEICEKLESNSSFLSTMDIPKEYSGDKISHNLPPADFAETGFIGRGDDVKKIIKKLISDPHPIITLFGVGGIGKTSLALKVAYSLLEDNNCRFEKIIWVTSKAKQLVASKIIDIKNAIMDSINVFEKVASELFNAEQEANTDEIIEEIIEYMKEFKILLILDNLENVLDERIRNFLGEIPSGSKVMITSRISVGAYDVPYPIKDMDAKELVRLLRLLADSYSAEILSVAKQSKLLHYVGQMKNNPGWIKWFVTAVASNENPDKLISNRKIFLRFCVENVYNHLSETAKSILYVIMLPLHKAYSISLLHYYSQVEVTELEQALSELQSCNMIEQCTIDDATAYVLSDIPGLYLKNYHAPNENFRKSIQEKKKGMIGRTEGLVYAHQKRPYAPYNIYRTSSLYRAAESYLYKALEFMKKGDLESAKKPIALAKEVAGDYFETHKVEAMLLTEQEDFFKAQESYELAIELKQDYPPLRLWFGKFLRRYSDDLDEAVKQLQKGREISETVAKEFLAPDEFGCELAIAFIYMKNFEDAGQELELLESKKDNYRDYSKKVIDELRLIWYKRYGEHCIEQKEFDKGLKIFEKMLGHYYNMPTSLQENPRNKKQVVSVLPHLRTLNSLYKDSPKPDNLIRLVNEISSINKEYEN